MPTTATGSKSGLAYVVETTWGTTPTSPTMQYARMRYGLKPSVKRNTFEIKEVTTNRQLLDVRSGTRQVSLDCPIVLGPGAFDDFLESLFGSTWATNVLKVGNSNKSFSLEVQDSDINTYEVYTGMLANAFDFSSQIDKPIEGNISFLGRDCVIAETTGVAVDINSTGKTWTRATGSFLTDGFVTGMPIISAGYTNGGNNGRFVSSNVTATVITCSSASGLVTETGSAATNEIHMGPLSASPTAANANSPYDSFSGYIKEGGSTIAIATGIDFKMTNDLDPNFALATYVAQSVTQKMMDVSGTINLYFVNQALKKKFLGGTYSSLEIQLASGAKTDTWYIPRLFYTSDDRTYNEGPIIDTLNFRGTYDGTTEMTAVKLTRVR